MDEVVENGRRLGGKVGGGRVVLYTCYTSADAENVKSIT